MAQIITLANRPARPQHMVVVHARFVTQGMYNHLHMACKHSLQHFLLIFCKTNRLPQTAYHNNELSPLSKDIQQLNHVLVSHSRRQGHLAAAAAAAAAKERQQHTVSIVKPHTGCCRNTFDGEVKGGGVLRAGAVGVCCGGKQSQNISRSHSPTTPQANSASAQSRQGTGHHEVPASATMHIHMTMKSLVLMLMQAGGGVDGFCVLEPSVSVVVGSSYGVPAAATAPPHPRPTALAHIAGKVNVTASASVTMAMHMTMCI